jgi:hypothetical protein
MFARADQGSPTLEAIKAAISAGDADALAKYLADNVEISIQDKEQVYSKAKATELLRSFFGANKPRTFSLVHKVTSRENSDQYLIGNLVATSGYYRVYLYLKVNGNTVTVQEMRFDKE